MKKFSSILAAAIAISGLAAAAHADFVIVTNRTTMPLAEVTDGGLGNASGFVPVNGVLGQSVDVITFQIMNDGLNGTGTAINGVNLTASTGDGSAFVYRFATGASKGVDVTATMGLDFAGLAKENSSAFGSSSGSFIRVSAFDGTSIDPTGVTGGSPTTGGGWSTLYTVATAGTPIAQPGGTYSENRNSPSSFQTVYDPRVGSGGDPGYIGLSTFTVVGGFPSGNIQATSFVPLATLVVPVGTTVSINGTVGGDLGDPTGVHVTAPGTAVPEPASLGLLAIGGLALLGRRRKA